MKREKLVIKRKAASKRTRDRILTEQDNLCAFVDDNGRRCTMPVKIMEHGWESGVPVGLGNQGEPDGGLCGAHAYLKTVNVDRPMIARAVRMGGGRGSQTAKRAAREAKGLPPNFQVSDPTPLRTPADLKAERKRTAETFEIIQQAREKSAPDAAPVDGDAGQEEDKGAREHE
jgi:hypothetical protein